VHNLEIKLSQEKPNNFEIFELWNSIQAVGLDNWTPIS
jgi:hypothetical protein